MIGGDTPLKRDEPLPYLGLRCDLRGSLIEPWSMEEVAHVLSVQQDPPVRIHGEIDLIEAEPAVEAEGDCPIHLPGLDEEIPKPAGERPSESRLPRSGRAVNRDVHWFHRKDDTRNRSPHTGARTLRERRPQGRVEQNEPLFQSAPTASIAFA
jgi:hypothetical protein